MSRHYTARAACFALALLFASCASRKGPGMDWMGMSSPPPTDLIQIHLFSLLTDAPAPASSIRAPLGFRLEGERIIPVPDPGSIAGTCLTLDEFATWQRAIVRDGRYVLHMAPTLAAEYGEPFDARSESLLRYVQNVEVHRSGKIVNYSDEIVVGTTIKATLQSTADPGEVFVSLEVLIRDGETDWVTASEALPPAKGLLANPLKLQLPRIRTHRIRAGIPIRYGTSVVALHVVRRRQDAASGRKEPVFDHLVCVVSAVKGNAPPTIGDKNSVREDNRSCALTLLAAEPYARGEEAASPAVVEDRASSIDGTLPPEQIDACATRLAQAGISPSMVGVLAAPGIPAGFEMTTSHSYLAGVTAAPGQGDTGPYSFIVRRQEEGMRFEADLASKADALTLAIHGRLAPAPVLESVREERPSLRRPTDNPTRETFLRQVCRQVAVLFEVNLPTVETGTYRLACLVDEMPGNAGNAASQDRQSTVLLTVLTPAARVKTDAPVPPVKPSISETAVSP